MEFYKQKWSCVEVQSFEEHGDFYLVHLAGDLWAMSRLDGHLYCYGSEKHVRGEMQIAISNSWRPGKGE